MVKKKNYSFETYSGGESSLNPPVGFEISAGELGTTTNPTVANQIKEVNDKLNQGVIPIEVGTLDPKLFESIPKTHFKEINRMAKLTGSKITIHAPLIEASGITEQGPWDEFNRKLAENQLMNVVDRTAEVSDKGGVSITVHSANMPGTEYHKKNGKIETERLLAINRLTGERTPLKKEEQFIPGQGGTKSEIRTPERRLQNLNQTQWQDKLDKVIIQKENADRILEETYQNKEAVKLYENTIREIYEKGEENALKKLNPEERETFNNLHQRLETAQTILEDSYRSAYNNFDEAVKIAKMDEDKKKINQLQQISDNYKKILEQGKGNPKIHSLAIQNLTNELKRINPDIFQKVEDFAGKKSSETFSNVAIHALKKYGDKAPVLNIENLYTGMAFSSGKEMDELIKRTKKEFIKKATANESEGGLSLSKSEAQKQADKLIGMTIDVGHLNMSRKKGFETEDLINELKAMAKHVKHVHLTDNFGYEDSHLTPGLGNVPFKEMLEVLEKEGVLTGTTKIVETGGMVQQFGMIPTQGVYEAFGSPMYTDNSNMHWNDTPGFYQNYNGGMGNFLPQVNYSQFGAGFSQLPDELGGSVGGGQGSRMSGRGME